MKSIIQSRLTGVVGCFALAALWTFVASPETAIAQGKRSFRVRVTFDDLVTDQILSDDSTPYYRNKTDRVIAIVGDGFRLDTTRGSRTLLMNFGPPNNDPGAGLFDGFDFGFASVDMRIAKQYVADESGNLILINGERQSAGSRLAVGSMKVGDVARAALSLRFYFEDAAGDEHSWVLGFADIPGSGDGRICSSSAPVKVTRVSSTRWRIVTVAPSIEEPGGGSACLWGESGVLSGEFDMPFGITIDAL